MQVVLNEAINTLPKLTKENYATLAIIYLLKSTINYNIDSHEQLGKYFDTYILPFINDIDTGKVAFQHLEFAGCGSITLLENKLEQIMFDNYAGLFDHGFDVNEMTNANIALSLGDIFFTKCLMVIPPKNNIIQK